MFLIKEFSEMPQNLRNQQRATDPGPTLSSSAELSLENVSSNVKRSSFLEQQLYLLLNIYINKIVFHCGRKDLCGLTGRASSVVDIDSPLGQSNLISIRSPTFL